MVMTKHFTAVQFYGRTSQMTKNELALSNFINNINKHFYYVGDDDDKVCKSEIKKFTEYCINFIDSLDYEN